MLDARLLAPGEQQAMLYSGKSEYNTCDIRRACIEADMRRRGTAAALFLADLAKNGRLENTEPLARGWEGGRRRRDDQAWLGAKLGDAPLPPAELRRIAFTPDARIFLLRYLRHMYGALEDLDAAAIPRIISYELAPYELVPYEEDISRNIAVNAGSVTRILIGIAGDGPADYPIRASHPDGMRNYRRGAWIVRWGRGRLLCGRPVWVDEDYEYYDEYNE